MRILFVSIWPADSGIFNATIPPTIKYWLEESIAEHVTLITFDKNPTKLKFEHKSLEHFSLVENKSQPHFFRLISQVYKTLKRVKSAHFDLIWARGVTSGNIAYLTSVLSGIPFGVESFEPHAAYMIEGRVWQRFSMKAIIQKWFEKRMIKNAQTIITVSRHYTAFLIDKHPFIAKRIHTMPCAIDFQKFAFNEDIRAKTRLELDISNDETVGIYVGKFGDIYYDDEFFNFLKINNLAYQRNRVIILTPSPEHAKLQIEKFDLDRTRTTVLSVTNDEVPNYLSASDYAFCPVITSPSRIFCSPIKTGEYMANGLPILISDGIGEDSEFIINNNLGKVVDFRSKENRSFSEAIYKRRQMIEAKNFRDFNVLFETYISISKHSLF